MRMRVLPLLAAAVLGVATAFVAACGDRNNLIPPSSAEQLQSALDDVAAATRSGDCTEVGQALARARGALLNLPESVDDRLVTRVREGIANLEQIAPPECARQQTQTETVPTTTATVPPETTATETTTTDTTPDTTPTDTTTTETAPPPATTTAPGEGENGTGGTTPEGDEGE